MSIALWVTHDLETIDPLFLFADLTSDFVAYGGSAWTRSGAGPFTHVELTYLSHPENWREIGEGERKRFLTVLRIQRPWFDPAIATQYAWRLNRAAPGGSEASFSDGVSCRLPLACIPQWVVVTRVDPADPQYIEVVGTIDVQSPLVPKVLDARNQIGKESISRSSSFNDLLDRLDNVSF
ncbi:MULTISPECIES: hypothetical protein [unclassified Mesorhizobium]|uniref:hypothetical protein n=1 Tax=unclassified Mesorhizobium TaxID=325217 RepID=UPI00333D8F32